MLRSKANWIVREADERAVQNLVRELALDPLTARLLVARGLADPAAADLFLHTGKASFHDPYQMDGMSHAVRRIRRALEQGEFIRVYGDYDADGVSSTALMIELLRGLGASFDWYIPHRVREGYGLNKPALEAASKSGVSLMITVDTGISAVDQIGYAAELGIDVIVTDHHEPPVQLPNAYAVLNPKKPGCPYPFKQLAGVGVAFKLAHALLDRVPEELLELATIGTVADLMPLLDENRLMVRQGLERMRRSTYAGIRALLKVSGADGKTPTAMQVGFGLAPRINAGGRLESANEAVRLLVAQRDEEAEPLAAALDELNRERQRLVDIMTREALEQAESKPNRRVLVLAQEGWNVGVIGIVASKVLDRHYCPTLVFGIDPATGMAKGSARSIAGFDLYKALTHCADLLEHYGGHQAAAGMTLSREELPELERRLQKLAEEWLIEEDYVPTSWVDLSLSLADAQPDTIRSLQSFAPFGQGNPPIQVLAAGLQLRELRTIGKEQQHVKLQLQQATGDGETTLEAVGFGKASRWLPQLSPTAEVDVLGELSLNEWNGQIRPQMILHDMRVLQPQLFDWRGERNLEKRWLEVLEVQETRVVAEASWRSQEDDRISSGPRGASGTSVGRQVGPAVLLFEGDRAFAGYDWLLARSEPIWTVDSRGRLLAHHEAAGRSDPKEVRDLLLLGMPDSEEQLESVLGAMGKLERVYAAFGSGPLAEGAVLPTRDMFKAVYAALQQAGSLDEANEPMLEVFGRRCGMARSAVQFVLEVFEELGFVERSDRHYRPVAKPAKRDLTESSLYQARVKRLETERTLIYSSSRELTRWVVSRIGASIAQEAIVHGF